MIPRLVPEIEGGYPERDREGGGEEEIEGLVLENSKSWIYSHMFYIFLNLYLLHIAAHDLLGVVNEGSAALGEIYSNTH